MLMTFLKPVLENQHQPLVEGSLKTSDSQQPKAGISSLVPQVETQQQHFTIYGDLP